MSQDYEKFQDLPEDAKPTNKPEGKWPLQGILMDRQIPRPSSALICFLSSLCAGLLFIIIILFVAITRQAVNQMEQNIEVKLRNLSLGVHSRVEGLSQHGSQMLQKLTAMQSFVKSLKDVNVISKVGEIESLVIQMASDDVTGSLFNDNQRILASLGELADVIWKVNRSEDQLCDHGWKNYTSSCYLLVLDLQSWSSAKEKCQDKKGHLVVINDKEEMDFLRTLAQFVSGSWIGLKEEDNVWKWVDGTSYDTTPKFWQSTQINQWDIIRTYHSYGNWEECGQLMESNVWNKHHCSLKKPYICEKKIP